MYDQLQSAQPDIHQENPGPDGLNGSGEKGHRADENDNELLPTQPVAKSIPGLPTVVVPISELQSADSPRFDGINDEHARNLAGVDAKLPPILVRRATMQVIDGMHRLNAAKMCGRDVIEVQFFDGDAEAAFLLAVESNVTHGLPLKIAERREAAARIIRSYPRMSDRSIAAIAGLAAKTIAAIRGSADDFPQVSVRVGRDGRVRPLNASTGRQIAGRMFVNQPDASLRKIAKEAGISVGTARDVRERIRRGEDPTLQRPRAKCTGEGGTTARPAAGGLRRPVDPVDCHSILEQLRRDPSLRYSESGRNLLRWLGQRAISKADWETVVAQIPPHCAIVVARIARGSATAWTDFADALDGRVQTYAA